MQCTSVSTVFPWLAQGVQRRFLNKRLLSLGFVWLCCPWNLTPSFHRVLRKTPTPATGCRLGSPPPTPLPVTPAKPRCAPQHRLSHGSRISWSSAQVRVCTSVQHRATKSELEHRLRLTLCRLVSPEGYPPIWERVKISFTSLLNPS